MRRENVSNSNKEGTSNGNELAAEEIGAAKKPPHPDPGDSLAITSPNEGSLARSRPLAVFTAASRPSLRSLTKVLQFRNGKPSVMVPSRTVRVAMLQFLGRSLSNFNHFHRKM